VECAPVIAPRPRAVLSTAKHPGRCPSCDGTSLSRKGSRTKKFETVQRWQCASCGRGFTPAPPELRAKTYPLRVILDGVTLYNLGYTLAEASAKLKAKSGCRVPSSTLAAWIAEHRDLTAYARLRGEGRVLFKPAQTIRITKLYHRQVYEYAYTSRSSRSSGIATSMLALPLSPTSLNPCRSAARMIFSRGALVLRRALPPFLTARA